MNGLARFIADVTALGMTVEARGALVLVTLDVGHPAAPELRLVATDPPADFPLTPPHWLHLPKRFVLGPDGGRDSELGSDWRRWSRSHPKWPGGANPARPWVAHARSLYLSAQVI